MRYFIQSVFVAVFLLLYPSCDSTVKSNNSKNGDTNNFIEKDYTLPTRFKIESKVFIFDDFYPIGWSADGKFAYITEPADEATGFYFFSFNIFDTHSQKIIWSWKIDEKNEQEGGNIKDTWTKNYKLFKSELVKNKITQINNLELKQFPISLKNQKIQFRKTIKYEKDKYFGFDVVSFAEFSIEKDGKKKSFYKKSFPNSLFLNITVLGYYKNPFGNEIFTLIHAEQRGYEGPPNVRRIKAGGCEL